MESPCTAFLGRGPAVFLRFLGVGATYPPADEIHRLVGRSVVFVDYERTSSTSGTTRRPGQAAGGRRGGMGCSGRLGGGTISQQCLQEYYVHGHGRLVPGFLRRRPGGTSWRSGKTGGSPWGSLCWTSWGEPGTIRTRLGVTPSWDSLIVAAARAQGFTVLLTERPAPIGTGVGWAAGGDPFREGPPLSSPPSLPTAPPTHPAAALHRRDVTITPRVFPSAPEATVSTSWCPARRFSMGLEILRTPRPGPGSGPPRLPLRHLHVQEPRRDIFQASHSLPRPELPPLTGVGRHLIRTCARSSPPAPTWIGIARFSCQRPPASSSSTLRRMERHSSSRARTVPGSPLNDFRVSAGSSRKSRPAMPAPMATSVGDGPRWPGLLSAFSFPPA